MMRLTKMLNKVSFESFLEFGFATLVVSTLLYEKKMLENDKKRLESDLKVNEERIKVYKNYIC